MRHIILVALLALLPVSAVAQGISNPGYPIGQITGTGTNDNAAVGKVGEFVSSIVPQASSVTLTDAIDANITSINLTAGDWDVWGTAVVEGSGGVLTTSVAVWTSATSATLPTRPNNGAITVVQAPFNATAVNSLPISTQRISIAGTTTIYLSVRSRFTVGGNAAYGFIGARRVR